MAEKSQKKKLGQERLLKIEEVAVLIGSSCKSINNWYWFKRENPDNPYAKLLPDYIQEKERQTRYWKESDIWKLLNFRQSIPQGKNGVMGSVTQRYYKKENKHGEQNAEA